MAHKRRYLSTALLFAPNINNHRCRIVEHNKNTWRTVHEHIVADAFCSKKNSSALLVPEQQASQT